MRLATTLTAAAFALAAGAADAGASVEVKDAVARVTVIPEARSDIKVEVVKANPRLPIVVRTAGDRTVVDGKLNWDVRSCRTSGGKPVVRVNGVGDVAWADMPQIVIRTPKDVSLTAGGAVFGAVGRSASLDLVNAGCGDWVVANVAGKLTFSQAGSGDSRIGAVGQAKLRSAGTGDIAIAAVRNGVTIDIAGSGDVEVGSASGPLDVKVAGSGGVGVEKGSVGAMTVSIAGSGDVSFGGVATSLKARVAGSGDVRAKTVTGPVEKHVAGSGDVRIG